MTKSDAVLYFDSSVTTLANALGCGKSAICNWGKYPPENRQIQIQYLTGGFLEVEPHINVTESRLDRKRRRMAFKRHLRAQSKQKAA